MAVRLDYRILGALAAPLFLVACGSSPQAASTPRPTPPSAATIPPSAAAAVEVVLREFSVAPDRAAIAPGEVTFRVRNTGTLPHQLLVVRSDLASTALPLKDAKDADLSRLDVVGDTTEFDAAQERLLTVRLTPGKYILLCNVPSHYLTGMAVPFSVR